MALPVPYRVCPMYRFRILIGELTQETEHCIRPFKEQQECEVVEFNIQVEHVHLLALVPAKISISNFVGILKGRTAIRILNKFRKLGNKSYWDNHFWSSGYCPDIVGLNEEMMRKYLKYQEKEKQRQEQ